MSEKDDAFQVAKQLTLRAIEELTEENVRLHLKNRQLREEVRVLRLYGNKDCTAMADEAMKEAALRREG